MKQLINTMKVLGLTLMVSGCSKEGTQYENILSSEQFETLFKGEETDLFTLKASNGAKLYLTNYGARIVGLQVPDKDGVLTDVVAGFGSIQDYIKTEQKYYGPVVGRFANRIKAGTFSINGTTYQLPVNNNGNSLHSGGDGFQDEVWGLVHSTDKSITFRLITEDGENGFPGELTVDITYTFNDNNELILDYKANTTKTTVVNFTNHAFFNLNGEGSGTILNHELKIFANHYTPYDETCIPTGAIESVKGTPLDFTSFKTIGKDIDSNFAQLVRGNGYDHNYVLEKEEEKYALAAIAQGDISGIVMKVYTSEPGMQFYTGNYMSSKNTFKSGVKDKHRSAFCLETQHFPDSPNKPNFPSTMLAPNKTFRSTTTYVFSIEE